MSPISSISPYVVPSAAIEGTRRSPQDAAARRAGEQPPLAEANKTTPTKRQPSPPSQEERAVIADLSQRDAEVRRHEAAHAAAGGQFAGAPTFQFTKGPNGRSFAVSGSVSIDLSPVPGDPQGTIQKMRQVKRAALAPANPSAADRGVAASADKQALAAQLELNKQRAEEAQDQLPKGQGDPADTTNSAQMSKTRDARPAEANQRSQDDEASVNPRQSAQAERFIGSSPQSTPELLSLIA